MPAAHTRKSTANTQKVAVALVASAAAVSASFVAVSPQAKTMAAQLPEITRQVKLTAGSDPISLIEGLLALPTSVAQELLGNGQWINNLAYLVAQPGGRRRRALRAGHRGRAGGHERCHDVAVADCHDTVGASGGGRAAGVLQECGLPPTGFAGSGLTGLNFLDIALASLVDFSAPATALFPAAVTLLEKLGIPLPLPGNLVPNAATNAALSPAITPRPRLRRT